MVMILNVGGIGQVDRRNISGSWFCSLFLYSFKLGIKDDWRYLYKEKGEGR